MIHMKPNELYELDLLKIGIPKKSKILHINYTPNGNDLFPVEVHGNSPYRHFIPHKILLYGRPCGEPTETTPVAVSINWVHLSENNEFWGNFVEAIEAYSIQKYQSAIIPANVAVEIKLNKIIDIYISQYPSEEGFKKRSNYATKLNDWLPKISKNINFPNLPDHVYKGLNDLRGYRNVVAHGGVNIKLKPLDKSTTGEILCSVSFALGYLNLIENKINNHTP